MIEPFFEFDGIRSDSIGIGLQIIRLEGGMFPIPYISSKSIVEDTSSRSLNPYFYRVAYNPFEFSLTFTSIDGSMDTDMLYQIGAWLFTDTPRKFVSSTSPSKMLYCIATNQVDWMTTGLDNGYFTVTFRSSTSSYLTLPQVTNFDLSDNTTYTNIQITNYSNIGKSYYMPEIEFELLDTATGIEIYNLNDGNRKFSMQTLTLLESVYVNNDKKQIISSTGNYRYSNLVDKKWLKLVRGVNNLKVVGKCNLQFRCQFPIFN